METKSLTKSIGCEFMLVIIVGNQIVKTEHIPHACGK